MARRYSRDGDARNRAAKDSGTRLDKCSVSGEQALHGYVSLRLAMAILIGSSIGSQLGALTTHYLPNRVLRFIFAGLVGATAVMIVWDLSGLLHLRD